MHFVRSNGFAEVWKISRTANQGENVRARIKSYNLLNIKFPPQANGPL